MSSESVLYKDKFIEMRSHEIVIKSYYFPTKKNLTVKIDEIKNVYYRRKAMMTDALLPEWGNNHQTYIWWALDYRRRVFFGSSKDYCNIVIDTEEKTKKGFSVENIMEFLQVIDKIIQPDTKIMNLLPSSNFFKSSVNLFKNDYNDPREAYMHKDFDSLEGRRGSASSF